jgi:hypothetical protein
MLANLAPLLIVALQQTAALLIWPAELLQGDMIRLATLPLSIWAGARSAAWSTMRWRSGSI